ncbi:lipase family alpha/beta hydrolase [Neptunomonas phycophila]|uniref:lipase family alpha/beta hydrolase n=1 Tax=Neptunomonas phycophila TaxID=1572645 RepID=UPI0015BF4AA8|nr:alpha/beta fold hydrolase [Neptunomonas phycophila]QLE98171.1 alpha/beta hydrolase [Neptunomonas phycophila]
MKKIKITIASALILITSGCMFIGLGEDVKQLKAAISISGKIESSNTNTFPIVVILNRVMDGKYSVQSYSIVYGDSEFFFMAPDGEYYLLAFEDVNQDFTLQDNERVGWYGSPSIILGESRDIFSGLTIELRDPSIAKKELPDLFVPGKTHKPVNLDKAKLGEVVSTSVFRQELGPMGMWEPVKFHQQGNSGIYFLEPYTEDKIPVLFVHGISGSGHDWLYLIEHLDQERIQSWIVQYPSGIRLGLLSKTLSESVNELQAIHNFDEMIVVAHSMGGLVSRGFINDQQARGDANSISTFITISTPWLGHNAASMGVKHAPVAVPSWFDMVPDSPYLAALHDQALPSDMDYYLLFSHRGKGGGIMERSSSDGTVTLASQLSLKAQEEAVKVIGYDEGHVSILSSHSVSQKINNILKTIPAR